MLLSVIEYVQFKALLKEHGQIGTGMSTAGTGQDIVFYSDIPKSTIVHRTNTGDEESDMMHISHIAGELYEKYIRRHSMLEINISGSLRNQWDALHSEDYPDDKFGELVDLIDAVLQEMLKYVRQSFLRFSNH